MSEMSEESLNVLMTKAPDESFIESEIAETNDTKTNDAGTSESKKKILGPLWWNLAIAALAAGVVVFNLMQAGVIQRSGTAEQSPVPGEAFPVHGGPSVLSYLPPGQLYAKEPVTGEPTVFHTLTVPRGRTFMVILSDGSKVWLKNESSLRYPVHFSGAKRVVELTGEAYFIVAPDPSKPFIVKTKYWETRVLHTRFMITTYGTETR